MFFLSEYLNILCWLRISLGNKSWEAKPMYKGLLLYYLMLHMETRISTAYLFIESQSEKEQDKGMYLNACMAGWS